jgi:glycosyltransferase involved in cell wall biosynthesis
MNGNKKNTPLVSVIMNCYNGDKYLKEAIDSVLKQTYTNWELIFWDNQSTDSSKNIIDSYDDHRIVYFYADNRTPLSKARNLAIEKSNGKYLAFLDSDDIWLPTKLEFQINGFIREPEAGISYCGFETLLTSNKESAINQAKFYSKFSYKSHNSQSIFKKLLRGNYIIFSTVIIKKDIFDLTTGFSEDLEQNEDYEILLKGSLYSNAICLEENLVKYRIHSSNNSYLNARKNFKESKYIYSNLPNSKDVKFASILNDARENIYYIFFEKKWYKILNFVQPKYWRQIFYLVYLKFFKLL